MFQRLIAYAHLMRLNRPWPILLIVMPTLWGLFLGPNGPTPIEIIIFVAGAFLTRSAGCVINDYFDQTIDRQIKRTKMRPLASGAIRGFEALLLFFFLIFVAFLLLLFLKPSVILLGFVALFLMGIYPLAKRFTYFPQVVLGAAFNFGIIMACLQVNGHISGLAWAYYGFSILWTVHYDTLYALADYRDDVIIGVKSIATFFHERVYTFLNLTSMACLGVLAAIWLATGFSSVRVILFCLIVLFFVYQRSSLLRKKEAVGLKLFKQHVWLGLLVLLGVVF